MTDLGDLALQQCAESLRRIANALEERKAPRMVAVRAKLCPVCHGEPRGLEREKCYFLDCPNIRHP